QVGRADEGHAAVARRTVDGHAHRLQVRADGVDVVDLEGQVAEVARAAVVLGRRAVLGRPVVRQLHLGFRVLRRAEIDQGEATGLVVHAPGLAQAQALGEETAGGVQVVDADHRVQVSHAGGSCGAARQGLAAAGIIATMTTERPHMTRTHRFDTLAAHAGVEPDPASGALAPPLQLATTFEHAPDASTPKGYLYQRYGSPNQAQLEQVLATLDGGA